MKKCLGILVLIASSLIGFGQSPIPDKRDLFSGEEYDHWRKSLLIANAGVGDTTQTLIELNIDYWNRFIVFAKLMPKNSSRVLEYFMDAFRFDRDYFCAAYLQTMDKHFWVISYRNEFYVHEKPIMNELCKCVITSYDDDLITQLKGILNKDQLYREQLKEKTVNDLMENGSWEKQLKLDSMNSIEIENLFNEHGYLDRSIVGYDYEDVMFLVVMHANLDLMKSVLPAIFEKVKAKKMAARMYAYLYDRICLLENRPQLYGTQYDLNGIALYNLQDPDGVNERRRGFGLPPIE